MRSRCAGLFCLLLLVQAFLTCQSPQPPKQLMPAFYHWKAVYKPTSTDEEVLRQNRIQRLYIRFFDVDWDEQHKKPVPKSVVRFAERPTDATVIPVVFITNRTMLALPASDVATLAQNVATKIQQIAGQNKMPLREVNSTATGHLEVVIAILRCSNW